MSINDEQAKTIKEQLFKQITQLPEDQQEQAKQYIEGMNNEQLEEFLKQNQIAQEKQQAPTPGGKGEGKAPKQSQCVFCAIANKEMEALALYEDKDYIAVLEIRPFSKGHAILIPKKHIKKTKSLPSKAFTLANRVGKHIVKKLKAESFQVTTTAEMNHAIINIIPIYKGKPLTYERTETDKNKLQELAMKIGAITKREPPKKKPKVKMTKEEIKKSIIQLPRRIP